MDLYVHPSYAEIEAISCLEAIKCGLVPVINNSNKSATKMFAKSERNLFKKDSAKSLAEQIDFWYENPDLKKEESQKYLTFSEDFDQTLCMKRMEEMLVEVVKNHKNEN
jgi:glycosyltransferase involved in cell wall biosynthesis